MHGTCGSYASRVGQTIAPHATVRRRYGLEGASTRVRDAPRRAAAPESQRWCDVAHPPRSCVWARGEPAVSARAPAWPRRHASSEGGGATIDEVRPRRRPLGWEGRAPEKSRKPRRGGSIWSVARCSHLLRVHCGAPRCVKHDATPSWGCCARTVKRRPFPVQVDLIGGGTREETENAP